MRVAILYVNVISAIPDATDMIRHTTVVVDDLINPPRKRLRAIQTVAQTAVSDFKGFIR